MRGLDVLIESVTQVADLKRLIRHNRRRYAPFRDRRSHNKVFKECRPDAPSSQSLGRASTHFRRGRFIKVRPLHCALHYRHGHDSEAEIVIAGVRA